MTPKRIEFRIAVLRSGSTMQSVAKHLGVSYFHLIQVLDGKRMPSKKLAAGIDGVMGK